MGRGRRGAGNGLDVPAEERQPHGEKEIKPPKPNRIVKQQQSRKRQKREEYRASIQKKSQQVTGSPAGFEIPKKKWFRQRAHANPFSDHRLEYPIGPDRMDWSKHFPAFVKPERSSSDEVEGEMDQQTSTNRRPLTKDVEIADIGCGFGGLLFALAPTEPDTLMLGLEIRTSVTEFVENKIRALRQQQYHREEKQGSQNPTEVEPCVPGGYQNISVVRTNSMKFLPNFFPKASLKTIFLCFPDPHFKSRKHKARIVSGTLNSEYAYVLREGGHVATITDVEELSLWMADKFDKHKSFERVALANDETETNEDQHGEAEMLVRMMTESTEEGKKVDRSGGKKFVGVWRRVKDPGWPGE